MKVLQLCLRVPFPPSDGGTIAMYNMACGLHNAGAQVKILAFNTKKHFIDPAALPKEYVDRFDPEMVYLDASIKVIPAILNLFGTDSYNISRFDTELFHEALKNILQEQEFDIIQLESLFVTPYINTIRQYSKAKVILRAHNMEYVIWNRLAASESNFLKKSYLNFLARRLKKYELSVMNKFDGILVLTNEDLVLFKNNGCDVPLVIAPIGVDSEKYSIYRTNKFSPVLFHLGSMDWLPNIEGIDWFLDNVLPLLKSRGIHYKIHLAGKSMPDRLMHLSEKNIVVTGRVDDAKGFMSDKPVMIVPLLSGGGMRVKIIEGLALGKTIISTSIGAEGIRYKDDENIIIADTPQQFCDAIVKSMSNSEYCIAIGKAAATLADSFYSNKVIGEKVFDYFHTIIGSNVKTAVIQDNGK